MVSMGGFPYISSSTGRVYAYTCVYACITTVYPCMYAYHYTVLVCVCISLLYRHVCMCICIRIDVCISRIDVNDMGVYRLYII